jgi:hypothetical protein
MPMTCLLCSKLFASSFIMFVIKLQHLLVFVLRSSNIQKLSAYAQTITEKHEAVSMDFSKLQL